ncbi:MAG: NUDIX domain-containing protein [Candidatus Shapirobacteria bacterium]
MSLAINRVSVIITHGQEIALIFRHKNNQDYYAIPGGHIEVGETPKDAAIREIQEELGLKLDHLNFEFETESAGRRDYYFSATTKDTDFVTTGPEVVGLTNPDNLFRPLWVGKSDLSQYPIFPDSGRPLIENIINQLC